MKTILTKLKQFFCTHTENGVNTLRTKKIRSYHWGRNQYECTLCGTLN